MLEEVTVQRDGLNLRGVVERPENLNNTAVILFHGFLSDRNEGLLASVSQDLVEHGFTTVRFDFDGCGQSDGDFSKMTVSAEISDAIEILNYVRKMKGIDHIYLVGHSQGGVVVSMLAGYYHDVIDRVALLAPAATLKDDAQRGTCMGVTYDALHVPDSITIHGTKIGGRYLRMAQTLPIYEVASQFIGPMLTVHGSKDKVVSPIASSRYAERCADCRLRTISGAGHSFDGEYRAKAVEIVRDFLTANEND